jgi:hypothetical protein
MDRSSNVNKREMTSGLWQMLHILLDCFNPSLATTPTLAHYISPAQ